MILLIYFLAVCLAASEAQRDADAIARHETIDHSQRWIYRASTIFGLSIASTIVTLNHVGIAYAAIGAAFLFSAVFRYRLNILRGLPFDYVSTSNVYDSVFIGLFGTNAGRAAYVTEAMIAAAAMVVYY